MNYLSNVNKPTGTSCCEVSGRFFVRATNFPSSPIKFVKDVALKVQQVQQVAC